MALECVTIQSEIVELGRNEVRSMFTNKEKITRARQIGHFDHFVSG